MSFREIDDVPAS